MKRYEDTDGNEITQQNYLYGAYGDDLPPIPADVSMRRIEALREHLAELLEHSYHTRDNQRVSSVLKAVSYWENISS